jgi:predicted Rossmann-fold nucleotide-binding protein
MLKIISGGQTGVDRAALDAAIAAGVPYAGWCPKGGWAEDMPAPPGLLARYPHLRETPKGEPAQRTEWNVRDSTALLVLTGASGLAVSPGTELALRYAEVVHKPLIVVDIEAPDALSRARGFLDRRTGDSLCVGGPRESEASGIYALALPFLTTLFGS